MYGISLNFYKIAILPYIMSSTKTMQKSQQKLTQIKLYIPIWHAIYKTSHHPTKQILQTIISFFSSFVINTDPSIGSMSL